MPWLKKNSDPKGFSLIEMLIVTSMLAVISLAIYATFNSGIKIWVRADKEVAQEDLNIFFDKFASRLRNSFKFSGISFSGKEDRLEFATIVRSSRMPGTTVGKEIYFYDSSAQAVEGQVMDFSDLYTNKESPTQVFLKGVTSFKLSYYFLDKSTKQYAWCGEWTRKALPAAVRIELTMKAGLDEKVFIRTINIPAKG